MPWATSDRRDRLPPNWKTIRKRILTRDRYRCLLCGQAATDVDHIERDAGDHDANLRSLCRPCHKAKTAAEAHQVMRDIRAKARHPVEQHPGLRRR